MIPDNLIEACFLSRSTSESTTVIDSNNTAESFVGNETSFDDVDEHEETSLVVSKRQGANMIGLVAVSLATGCIISYVGDPVKPVYHIFVAIRIIVFHMVGIFIWYSPVGIAFLVASTFAGMENIIESLRNLAIFAILQLGGLFFHAFVLLPMIYLAIVRKNPYVFLRNILPAILMAFGSESSGVTLPVTIRCLEEKNKLDTRVSRLVASVGATINMDAASLSFSMMALFIAQMSDITLNAGQIVTAGILSISVAVGIGCIPGGQIPYMFTVPLALHLPTDNVSMLLALEWMISRCRTVVNVTGDCFGAGIVECLSAKELQRDIEEPNIDEHISDEDLCVETDNLC